MSQAVKRALTASQDLKPTERLVLVAIAAHESYQTGTARPSVQTIAEYVGCSVRTVQRVISKLIQLGRLVVSRVAGIATHVYRLVTGQNEDQGVSPGSHGATESGTRGDSQEVSPEVVKKDLEEVKGSAAPRRRWRDYLPSGAPKSNKSAPTNRVNAPAWAERRGAALPPVVGIERCSRHLGELAHNCRPCRSEALVGDR
jgi:DNA-binding transcriptional MocR family regulator